MVQSHKIPVILQVPVKWKWNDGILLATIFEAFRKILLPANPIISLFYCAETFNTGIRK